MRLSPAERRRSPRIRLQVPLFLRGTDDSGSEFVDLTKTVDISATGAFLACRRGLRADQLLRLTDSSRFRILFGPYSGRNAADSGTRTPHK